MFSVVAPFVRQIEADFPHQADLVQRRLTALGRLIENSAQDHERLQAAVIRVAAGRLDRLDQAIELARIDWRDLLVTACLADEDWPTRLSAWLEPTDSRDTASPSTRGELTETDGHHWQVRRRRIDLRMVKMRTHEDRVMGTAWNRCSIQSTCAAAPTVGGLCGGTGVSLSSLEWKR